MAGDGFKAFDVYGEVHLDTDSVDREIGAAASKAGTSADRGGRDIGDKLSQGIQASLIRNSPLIAAAIGGGLSLGAPAALAGAGVLFGGIAALALKSNAQVSASFTELGHDISDEMAKSAEPLAAAFVLASNRIGEAVRGLQPAFKTAFTAAVPLVDSLTAGVTGLATNAMPGLVRAVQSSGPAFTGLSHLLADTGSGISGLFDQISAHGDDAGQIFDSLGQIIQQLLPTIGRLLGVGSELASAVLPGISAAVSVVAGAVEKLEPILPALVAGFTGLKIVNSLNGVFGNFAATIETAGAKTMVAVASMTASEAAGAAAGRGFQVAAAGARALEAASGPIGLIIAGLSLAIPFLVQSFGQQDAYQKKVASSAQSMTDALRQSKGAIDDNVRATAATEAQKDGLLDYAKTWGISSALIVDAITGQKGALKEVQQAASSYSQGQQSQADAIDRSTSAGMLQSQAFQQNGQASDQAAAALARLSGNTSTQVGKQQELAAALDGSTNAEAVNRDNLQAVSDAASAANTQISLLSGALDALTGKTVTMNDAEIAVTNAVVGATNATQSQTGALTTASGALDLHTQRGAAAWQALTQLGSASNQLIGTMEQQGSTTAQVAARDAQLRDQFVQTARQMGFSASEADNLANQILGIPTQRAVQITAQTAAASANVAAFQAQLNAIHDRTVNIIARSQLPDLNGSASGSGRPGLAIGGIIEPFASGGWYTPMKGNIADIVAPNTMRLIGDNVRDDEAYIPINGSARSRAILAQTNARMGYSPAQSEISSTTVLNYYAAPGQSFTSDDQLFSAASRARMMGLFS